ncbi:MAG: hypothetical protein K1X88_04775 [Nannocystaceae bacterium]|nr:hypothetical protein [Nannocystaceae bacterium]
MVRTAIALACFALVAACGKDVEDPGFTATASATMTAGTTTTGDDSTSSTSGASVSSTTQSSNSASDTADTTAATDPSAGTSGPTTDTMGAGCGDGMVSPGEQCDGDELQGFTCMSLGLNGGTLSCDPVTCTFDTSMCMSTSGGTSG